jgi:hypothetical protein
MENFPVRHALDMDMNAIIKVVVPKITPQVSMNPLSRYHRKLVLFPPKENYQLLD